MIFYITVSGKGFRILLRYMRPEGCNLTATELHQLAIRKAMSMYDKLLGISSDKQCQDMVRSCGLAYDPEAYFNWNAEVLAITREEVENFEKATKGISSDKQCQDMVRSCGLAYDPEAYFNWNAEVLAITREEVENFEKATKQQEEQNRKRQTEAEKPRKKSPRKQEDEAPPKTLTTEEILQYVDKLAESWEERFEEQAADWLTTPRLTSTGMPRFSPSPGRRWRTSKKLQSNRRNRTGKDRRRRKNPERKARANRKTRRHPRRSPPKRFCSM